MRLGGLAWATPVVERKGRVGLARRSIGFMPGRGRLGKQKRTKRLDQNA